MTHAVRLLAPGAWCACTASPALAPCIDGSPPACDRADPRFVEDSARLGIPRR